MSAVGDKHKGTIKPDFDTSISIDFQGVMVTSDTGFLVMRAIDQRFNILSAAASQMDDRRSQRHTDHFNQLWEEICRKIAKTSPTHV